MILTTHYLILSIILFSIGTAGVMVRRNLLVVLMSLELMLNGVNISLVAFSQMHGNMEGQVLIFFSMVVAAAEVALGLAIVILLFRQRRELNIELFNSLKG